jgi:hypothetical protein
MPIEAATQGSLPPFYATAAALLVTFLITWLVAEARSLREELRSGRRPLKRALFLVAVAVGLTSGAVVALRVEFVDRVTSAEKIVIWSALGLGFAGAAVSVAQTMLLTGDAGRDVALLDRLRVAQRLVPFGAAVAVGIVVSPLVQNNTKTVLAGAKFPVYGTCISGSCKGLKQRIGPGANYSVVPSGRVLPEGTLALVVCQTTGRPPVGSSNPVWDKLASGVYVSDAFVYTGNRHAGFSVGIPHCGPYVRGGGKG